MSRTIDEKVVEMRFDNQNFEKNVSQSMSTLDKLKSALDFSGVDKTFSGLTDAANKLNLGSVGDAIEGVGNKFSWLETVAVGALMNIGAQIEDKLVGTLKGLTLDQVTAGFDKYADKSKAVQTIMAATGMEIGEVSKQLDRLMWYTDETSYDFSDMVNNVGKFTSAGVDLETAVTAMEGISNLAAISGQGKNEAGRVMYNLSQALSMGAVTLQDWKSIELANMGTKEFREMAIQIAEAQGAIKKFHDDDLNEDFYATYTLDEFGNAIADVEVNWLNFRDTLKEKWFNTDVLLGTLGKYGDFANELNKVYDEINNTEGFEVTTSELIDMANAFADNTLDMDQAMATTGKTAEELTAILSKLASEEYELGRKAFAAGQEARTFKDAIDATKDAVSTQFMRSFEIIFGNYEEAKVLWTDLANELWDIFAGPLSDINKMLAAWRGDDTVIGGRVDLIESIKNLYRALRSYVDPISEAWEAIFPSMTYTRLREIVAGFKNFTEGLILSEEQMAAVSSAFEGIFGIMKIVGDGVKELAGSYLSKYFSGFDGFTDAVFRNIQNIGSYLDNLIHILPRMKSAREAFAEGQYEALAFIQKWEKTEAFVQRLSDIFGKLKESARVIGELGARFLNLKASFNSFYQEGGGVAGVLEVIAQRFADVMRAVEELIHIWTGVDIAKWVDPIVRALFEFQDAIKTLQSDGSFDALKEKFLGIFDAFEKRFGSILSWFTPLKDAFVSIINDFFEGIGKLTGGGIGDMTAVFRTLLETIGGWFDSAKEFINTSETLKTVIDTIKDSIQIIADFLADFLSLSKTIDTFTEAGGGFAGVLAVINDKFRDILDVIGQLFTRITGWDLNKVKDTIMLVIKVIEEGLLRLADLIAKTLGWEDNPFHRILESSSSAYGQLQDTFNKFSTIDLGGFDGLREKISQKLAPLTSLFDGFKNFFTGIWSVVQKVLPLIGSALTWVGTQLSNFGKTLSGMELSDILDLIRTGGLALLFFKMAKAFDGVGEVLDAWQTKLKADTLRSIGFAILEIAGAALIIGMIPKDTVVEALIGIGEALAGLIATVFSVMSLSGSASARSIAAVSTTMIAVGAAMVEIAVALQTLVIPLKTIAAMDSEELDRGLKGVLYAVGELAAVLGAVGIGQLLSGGTLQKGTKSLKTIASALLLVLGVIKLYTLIDVDQFEEGLRGIDRVVQLLGKIAGMLGLFTVGLTVIDALITHFSGRKNSAMMQAGFGIESIAVALLALSAALWVLSKIDPEKFAGAVTELAIAFAALGITSVLVSALVRPLSRLSKAMEGLGKGVFLLTVSAMAIGAVAYIFGDAAEKLAKATGDLIVALLHVVAERAPLIVEDLISILMSIIDGIVAHTPEIVDALMRFITGALEAIRPYVGEITAIIMDIVNEVISEVNKALEGVDTEKMKEGGGFLGGLMLSILGLGKLAKSPKEVLKNFLAFETLLAGALVVIAELGLVFGALGAFAETTGGVDAIKSFGEVAEVMGNVLISKFGILFAGIMVLLEVQKYISDFLKATPSRMLDSFKLLSIMIFYTSTLVGEMGLLFGALGALSSLGGGKGKEALESFGETAGILADILTSKVGALLGAIVVVLGILSKFSVGKGSEAFKSLSGSIWSAVGVVIEAIAAVSAVVDAMALLFAAGGGIIAGLDWLIGGWNDLPDNAIELGIKKFGDILEAIGDVIGRFIGALTGPIVEAVEQGRISGMLEGFTDGLVYFSENADPFFEALEGLGENGVDLAGSFIDMIYKLTAADFLNAINIFKDKNYEDLGNKFAELGNAINKFADKVKDLDEEIIKKAAVCAQIVVALAQEMPSTDGVIQWIKGEKNMGKFGTNLVLLGAGLESFQGATENLTEEAYEHAAIIVKAAAEMSKDIPVNRGLVPWILGINDMGKFGNDLGLLGAGMKSFQDNTSGISEDAINSAAVCVGILAEMSREIPDQGNWFRDLFTDNTGMDDFGKNLEKFGASFKKYTDSIDGISEDTLNKTSIATGVISEIAKVATTISMFKNGFVQDGKEIRLSLDDFEDFGKKLKALGGNLKEYAKSIKDVDSKKLSEITKGISDLIDVGTKTTFKDSFFDLFQSFSEGMVKAFDDQNGIISKFKGYLDTIAGIPDATLYNLKFIASGGSIGKAISKGFADAQSLTATVQEVLDELIGIITNEQNIESFNKTGRQLLAAFGDGFTNASFTATWQKSFGEYLDSITAMITDEARLQTVRTAGVTFALAIFEGMQNADATSAITKITETISNGIGMMDLSGVTTKLTTTINTALNNVDVTQASTSIGNNITAGVAQGTTSKEGLEKVAKAAQEVITTADEAARKAAVIRSPSLLFAIIGRFLDEGLAEGIFDNIPVVEDAVSSVIGAVADGASGQSLIDMMKASGFNVSDTLGSSILEASSDAGDYGSLVSQMFTDGMFDNLTETLDTDFVRQFTSGMSASLPGVTSIAEEYGYEVGEAWDEGTFDYLSSDYGIDIRSSSIDAMSSALPTVSSQSYQYGYEVGEAWGEGYNDEMLEIEDTYANLEIQGPTVTFVADTSQVKEALDEFVTYYGQKFAKNGELDGYLLAFDMADEAGKRAMIEQAQYEWANDELANTLRLRQIQADELLMQDAYWQNMASTLNASNASLSGEYESDYVTKEDLIEATTGMKEEIEGLRSDNQNMMLKLVNANVYLDSGELVGALAPGLDRQFGNLQKLGGRGI